MDSEKMISHLSQIEVMDETGNPVRISDLWKDKKAAVVFIRHFG